MPSALTNYGSVAEMQREGGGGSADNSLVGKVDGAIRRASTVIKDSTTSSSSSSPTAATQPVAAEERAVTEAAAGQGKKKPNKHSMDYIVRSFVAGGLAGCAVSGAYYHLLAFPDCVVEYQAQRRNKHMLTTFSLPNRPKPPSRPSTESRSSFKQATRNSPSIPGPGLA